MISGLSPSRRQRRTSRKQQKRQQIVEQLESRQLLAGDWNDQRTELISEIDKLSTFADHVESTSSLSQPLAIFGSSFNDRLDFSAALSSEFVTPLKSFLQDAGRAIDAQAVVDYLRDELPGDAVVSVSTTAFGDERVFDTTLYLTDTVDYQPQLDPAADAAGLTFDSSQSSAEFGVTLDLRFGADEADDFFAIIRRMDFSVVDAAEVSATEATPDFDAIDRDITFTLRLNDDTSVTATLPANTQGNVTPLVDRLNAAIRVPLGEAGFAEAVQAVDTGGRLAFRSVSASVQRLSLSGDGDMGILGFPTQLESAKSFQPDLDYGLISLESTDGGITVGGTLQISADTGIDDHLDSNELSGVFGFPELETSSRGFVRAALSVRPTTEGLFDDEPMITATSGTLFRGEPVSVKLQSFQPIDALHDQATETLRQGFSAITQFGARLESGTSLSSTLPAMDTTLAEATDLESVLHDRVQSTVESLLASNLRPSWDDLAEALNQVAGVNVSATAKSDQQVSLDIALDVSNDRSQKLALGRNVTDSGFAAPDSSLPDLDLVARTDWSFSVQIDRSDTASPLNAFGVSFDHARHHALIDQGVDFQANVGFLQVTASGDVDLNATLDTQVGQASESVSAGRLLNQSLTDLVTTTPTGNFDVNLGLSGTVGASTLSDGAVVMNVSGAAVFDEQSQLQLNLVDSGQLADFVNVSADGLASGIRQIGGWLADYAEGKLGDAIPLAETLRYADVLDLSAVFDELVVSQLNDGDGKLSFSSAQQLGSSQVMSSVSNPQYDSATQTITFDVDFSKLFQTNLIDKLAFDFEIGDFIGFETNADISLTPTMTGLFRLGFDMRPLGAGDAAIQIDTSTTLDSLGVTIDSGDDVEISLRDGSVLRVNFDGATDLGDVIDALNAASSKIHAELRIEDGIALGLQVTDQSSDGGSTYQIRSVGESLTGLSLGILGEFGAEEDDPDAAAIIKGLPLHGDTIAHHVFVEERSGVPIVSGSISIAAPNFSATANLGFTEVSISGGEILASAGVPSHVTTSVSLPQPRMTLADLFAELESTVEASFDGLIEFTLPVMGTVGGVEYGGSGESLTASISDFEGDLSAALSGTIDAVLEQLANVDAGDVLGGLIDGLENLLSVDGLTLPVIGISLPEAIGLKALLADLTVAIQTIGAATLDVLSEGVNRMAQSSSETELSKIDFPEIDVSLADLFSFLSAAGDLDPIADPGGPDDGKYSLPDLNGLFADLFEFEVQLPDVKVTPEDFDVFLGGVSTILDQLQLSGPGSLQGLESALESATGLSPGAITLQVDTSIADAISVRFDLMLDKVIQAKYPMRVDLADLGVDGIGNLIDVGASSEVMLSAGAAATLSLGVQVDGGGVKPFLYTDASGTHLTLSAGASANDIDFEASLGPFGIGVVNGVAGIGIPGPGPADPLSPATYELTFDDADGRYFFLEESLDLESTATGGAIVRLPLEAPLGSAPINIQMDVADLTQPVFQFGLYDAQFANPIDLNGDTQFDSADVAKAIQDKIDALGNVGDNLLSLVGGWEGAFDLLIDTMKGEVLGVPLPIIGDALADQATFLEDVKQSVLDNIEDVADQGVTMVQVAIFDALGPSGLGVLQDRDDDADTVIDFRDVKAVVSSDRVEFDLDLSQDLSPVLLGSAFDLGLPGLNFDLDADVTLDLDFDFKLGFGVSTDEGFYFVTDESRTDLGVTFTAEVTDLDATGRQGFLELNAQNVDGSPTQFVGHFDVDVSDSVVGDGNGRLSLSEMFGGDFSDVITHSLTAQADAAIRMELSAGDTSFLPRLRADLIVDWNYGPGAEPNGVAFENVQMNLGDFFSGFAGNTLREVQKILDPVQPVINTLTARLPVLSDLGGRDVTLVDVARLFGRADVADFITSVIQVNDLITGLPPIEAGTWVDLGGFDLDPTALGGYEGVGSTPSTMKQDLQFSISTEPSQTPLTQTGNAGGGGWTNNLSNAKGSLSFPLLESPSTAFKLLLGKDVDLFLYDAPALGIDFTYYQNIPTPIPFLFAELGGRIAAVADFAFGFDTTGINRFKQTGNAIDIFDGFFVSDRANPDGSGADVPEVYLRGSLTAGAKVDFLIAEAGVRGGIFADVNFNLHDSDQDGRVRAGEIAENFALGPVHIFDVDGKVDAGLTAFLNVDLFLFQINEEYEIARVNLLDFEVARPVSGAPTPESVLLGSRVPKADGSGDVLTIQFTQQDDTYKILPGSQPGSIVVQGQGMITKDIMGVAEIIGHAGDGNDTVTVSSQVQLPVTIHGGVGDDVLTAGGGVATFTGGVGNDQLTGGVRADHLDGGDGSDVLVGGDGGDSLIGGPGNDYLDGGRDQDDLQGGDGNDQLLGGRGADQADGQAGDDTVDGGDGEDMLFGGTGRDVITGGRGNDIIDGGDDDDELFGQEGADEIDGGRGNDLIEGGQRNDVIRGGEGDDTLSGGTGNDEIDGNAGDDVIRGGAAQDEISGGDGNDLIFADEDESGGSDPASHTISGGAGNDTIFGSIGADVIDAGTGDDRVVGLAMADVIIGGLGNDDLDGGSGSDLVWGGEAAYLASAFDLSDSSLFEKPLRYDEATTMVDDATAVAGYSAYTLANLVTPKVVAGLSVPGVQNDGNDVLRGGDDIDWLFGGTGSDAIFGGGGDDYIDGGNGNDTNLFGDDGDDVIRGGFGSDVIHGGQGIDQIYGDEGRDTLYGDGGDVSGSTEGQRLFGGDDVDSLFAWSADTTTVGGKGDQLFGGGGGDFLYGNLSDELLFGESGADYLGGDWAAGPDYQRNQNAVTTGGDDTLLGGAGQDQAYGGGGNDVIRGGADGDWLEGQDGNDKLLGGGGIDFLVLDVNPNFSEQLDGHGSTAPDDNATDILMINGTTGDDVIRIGSVGGRLRVSLEDPGTPANNVEVFADWTAAGVPLVEQFRVAGLAGDDVIEFENSLDLTALISRSRDFVTQIDGGPGNDLLIGSSARDRIDGGRGSDTIFGNAGDDRLWGDQGAGDGSVVDQDVIYAGGGNDDVLGGQGNNRLFAWSMNPLDASGDFYGIYLGSDGSLNRGIPAADPNSDVTYQLEDTGLNRIIGSERDDDLYGGTGLDLLFGGGGDDRLFTRDGALFEDLDGQQSDDAWKAYARATNHVWYVGGSNADDVISVDFVTEPGILNGHHLVTRLTDNNGNFSFDAQVRLDFGATDEDGNLIWNPNDLIADSEALGSGDPFERADALGERFSDASLLGRLLPSEGDFQAIIIDALDGKDQVTVGPTVQKSIWIDAGNGDDVVKIESGRAILIDQTDPIGDRNDLSDNAFPLIGPALLIGPNPAVTNGVLKGDATFFLIVDELDDHVRIDVPQSITDGSAINTIANTNLDDLVEDINRQINKTAAAGRVIATRADDAIALSTIGVGDQTRLGISADAANPAVTKLGLSPNALATPTTNSVLVHSTVYGGLTIDNPNDVDHYAFELAPAAIHSGSRLSVESVSVADGVELTLLDAATGTLVGNTVSGAIGLDLSTLQAGTTYVARVTSNLIPTIYSLKFDLIPNVNAVGVDLGAITDYLRQDVIFGGNGNDILQGGPGEDFVFGGPGNDVLTGGQDRGSSDLLFGQAGDDTFQSIPDSLPLLTGTETTFLPTQSDRYDGGTGNNRVLVLGGDLDRRGLPINDFVAMKYNRLLGRYETSSLVWDINNQRYVPADDSDVATGDRRRLWHFFDALNVRSTTIDLRAGNDVVHLDPGFEFAGDATGTTWGIAEGDLQSGAVAFSRIDVFGGDGNDRLFGGATSENLFSGDGSDFVSGGLGNDTINGGPSNDFLTGGDAIPPDDFEFVSRTFGAGPNDTFQYAALLPDVSAGDIIRNLSFHDGDPADWYVLRPRSTRQFSGQAVAAIRDNLILALEVEPTDGQPRTGEQFKLALFLAESTGSGSELGLVPVDAIPGAAEYLLLRVSNQTMSESEPSLEERLYELEFLPALDESIDVSVSALTTPGAGASHTSGFSRQANQTQVVLGGQPMGGQGTVIPIGDFNGDGIDDFVMSFSESIDPVTGGVNQLLRIVYGGDPLLDPEANAGEISATSGTVLVIPSGSATSTSLTEIKSMGDVDNDGNDDLVFVTNGSLAILFGSTVNPDVLEFQAETGPGGRALSIGGFINLAEARIVGDTNNDGHDDVVAVDDSGAKLFLGKPKNEWLRSSAITQPNGVTVYDFATDEQGFTLDNDNDATRSVWHVENSRLVMGGTSTYANGTSSNDLSTVAETTSPVIDLRGALNPMLKFDHLLQTEQAQGFDIARIFVEVDGQSIPLAGATNQGSGILTDGMSSTGAMVPLSFSLSGYAGSEIRLRFSFDTVGPGNPGNNNSFYGWAIDNLRIEADSVNASDAEVDFANGWDHVAQVGDFNGDGFEDFGLVDFDLGSGQFSLFYGGSDVTTLDSLTVATGLVLTPGMQVFAANLNGDAFSDAIMTGRDQSVLLVSAGANDGTGPLDPLVTTISLGGLRPIGDWNGDGMSEFAASKFELTNSIADPAGEKNAHAVTHVYFSGGVDRWAAPDLVLEMSDALFTTESGQDQFDLQGAPLFNSLGDLDGDGISDLGVYSPLQAQLAVIYGGSITANTDGGTSQQAVQPIELAPIDLGTPTIDGTSVNQVQGIDLADSLSNSLSDAFAIEGDLTDDQLRSLGTVGDFNGDGFLDIGLRGANADYLLFGPFEADGVTPVSDLAHVVISGKRFVTGYGDVIGNDGVDDIVLIREDSVGGSHNIYFEIHAGGVALGRDFESTPDVTLLGGTNWDPGAISGSILNWDGDGQADLLYAFNVPRSGFFAVVSSGADLLSATPSLINFDTSLLVPPAGSSINANATFTTTPIGDINGDGLDDLAIASPSLFTTGSTSVPIGAVYLILGGTTEETQVATDSHAVIRGASLGSMLSPLGDINNDGYDDFGVSRALEGAGDLEGGMLIYYGQPSFRTDPTQMAQLDASDAAVRVSRAGASSLSPGIAVTGPLQATAGDLDDDGKTDLVVAASQRALVNLVNGSTFQSESRGETIVFFDVNGFGDRIDWDDADRTFRGSTSNDLAGQFSVGPLVDFDGDKIDDFFIGATGFDGLINGIDADAGRVYFVPGTRLGGELPEDVDVSLLENFNGMLVDRQTGQPEIFGDLTLAGDEAWFRFTLAGDGSSGSNVADHIRVTPGSSVVPISSIPVASASVADDGSIDFGPTLRVGGDDESVSVLEFDLRYLSQEWMANPPQTTLNLQANSTANVFRSASFDQVTTVNDRVFFVGDDIQLGSSLYVSDATTGGTFRLTSAMGANPSDLTQVGDTLFFTANENVGAATTELWKSDGTLAGTVKVTDIDITAGDFVGSSRKLYFTTRAGLATNAIREVWESDGTPELTFRRDMTSLFDPTQGILPGTLTVSESDVESQPILFFSAHITSYFDPVLMASPGNNGNDGRGIRMVGDTSIGTRHREPVNMHAFDGFLAFQATASTGNPTKLLVTNGVIESSPQASAFSLFFSGTQPANPSGFFVDKDSYQLTPASFNRAGDYDQWVASGLDLNRDTLYVFGDSPDGADRSLYRIQVESIFDNGIRSSGIVNRENYTLRLSSTEVASQIPDNAHSLVMRGDDLFFIADDVDRWGTEVFRVDKNFTTTPTFGQTPRLISDIDRFADNSDPQDLIVLADRVFFTAFDGITRGLYEADEATLSRGSRVPLSPDQPTDLAVSGSRLLFTSGDELWWTDGATAQTVRTDAIPTADVTIGILDQFGDGIVTATDRTASLATSVDATFTGNAGQFQVDLTAEIAEAIAAGRDTLTVRIEMSPGNPELQFLPTIDAFSPSSRLDVLPSGLVADLLDEDGSVRSRGKSLTDLRNVKAGTYYLRVHRPQSSISTDLIEYSIEIDAPTLGHSHSSSDRDRILGGDGDDRILGGAELDSLFGQSGLDQFQSETIEVFDLDPTAGETISPVAVGEESHLRLGPDSDREVLVGASIDPALRAGIARALGRPVTTSFTGQPLIHQPIFASELAELERLDLSGLGITDLGGLEDAVNLRFLDLSNNFLTGLELPGPLASLNVLVLSHNQIGTLEFADLDRAPNLHVLFLDGNRISDLSQLAGIRIVDDGDADYSETTGTWQNEVFAADGVWLDDYRYSKDGGEAVYSLSVADDQPYELFMTWPMLANQTTNETEIQIYDGPAVGGALLATIPIIQSADPGSADAAADFGGRPWESLGEFTSTAGVLSVVITGVDGSVVAADAVRAERINPGNLPLQRLSLLNNPINDVSRDEMLGRLHAIYSGLTIDVTPNPNAPQIAPLPPQTVRHGSLDLDDSVAVLPRELLNGVNSFMVEFQFRTETADNSSILSVAESNSIANEFLIQLRNPTTVRVIEQNTTVLDFVVPSNLGLSLIDGQWHHYAIVRDGAAGLMRVFVDGHYLGEKSSSTVALNVAARGLVLGQEQDDVNGSYQSSQAAYGQLDELRFWDRFWDDPNAGNQFALQFKRVLINKDKSVSSTDPDLRAQYKFDETSGSVISDSGPSRFNGTLGDTTIGLLDAARDTRPPATRSVSAPIMETAIIDLRTLDGTFTDADGEFVRFTATSDNPSVVPRPSGSIMFIDYPADLRQTARITVTLSDEHGRQSRTSFDWNVDGQTTLVTDITRSTILTFDGPFTVNSPIDEAYGDRVTATTVGGFSYGGGVNGPQTPNITVDYGDPNSTLFYNSRFGDLVNNIFKAAAATTLDINLIADPGFKVALHGFDLGGYDRTDRVIDSIEVVDQSGQVLYSQAGITVLGTGSAHSDFDFPEALVGESLMIRLSPGAFPFFVGIDNIQFSQIGVSRERFEYGSVYSDFDGDGSRDAGEVGVPGVTVQLFNAAGNVVACTVTDAEGNYRLGSDFASELDRVEMILPIGWEPSSGVSTRLGQVSPSLPIKQSIDFEFNYEFDVDPRDPAFIDLDANGFADMTATGSPLVAGGVTRITTNQLWGANDDTTTSWPVLNPTVQSGYTIEARVKIIDDGTTEGSRGSFTLATSADGTNSNGLLNIGRDFVGWGLSTSPLATVDNTDDFHDYRLVQLPGQPDQYFVWRDDVLLNPGGTPLDSGVDFQLGSRLVFGDGGVAYAGTSEVDSIRFTKGTPFSGGAFGPTNDLGATRQLHIGPDRSAVEGQTLAFAATTTLALTDYTWTVMLGSVEVASGTGEPFQFTPDDEGEYLVSLSAINGGSQTLTDQATATVINAAPVVSVNVATTLPVAEGSTVQVSGVVDDAPTDSVASYRWSLVDSSGQEIESMPGSGPAIADWMFAVLDEGVYHVVLSVTDNDGATGTSEPQELTFQNVEPNVTSSLIGSASDDGVIQVDGTYGDPGADLLLGLADFGDGTRKPIVLDGTPNFSVDHQYKRAGRYEVKITIDDQDGGTRTESFEVDYQPAVEIDRVEVNGGDSDRSQITSVGVSFDQAVHVSEDAFVLRNLSTGEFVDSLFVNPSNDATVVELTFLPGPSVVSRGNQNSLADGNYQLVVSASGVESADEMGGRMLADFVFGDEPTDDFFRMLGDSDGDRDVDGQDYGRFALSFMKSHGMTDYDAAFDSDGDGDVDGLDYGLFDQSFLKSLPF